ncbi:MAG TPA: PEP-CTERM sorting domain-containing protein [Rhizomicrobium sp.]|nr:PEP-CTERM sorting domain-containing protein [Rhizomicrobium sp.]
MKKKRVKFGLAVLGGLGALLLALFALVFAPSLASAGKGTDIWHDQNGGGDTSHRNPAYFAPPSEGGSNNDPHYAGNGVGPCTGTPNPCDTYADGTPDDGAWHQGGGPGGGQGNDQDNGHSPNGEPGNNLQGGQGNQPWLFTGGYPGGGGGGGGSPQDKSKSCSSDKDKSTGDKTDNNTGNKNGNKACDNGSGDGGNNSSNSNDADFQLLTVLDDKSDDSSGGPNGDTPNNSLNNDPPGDDDGDLPPVDPNCFPFSENCGSHDGNPPDTVLIDPPNKVPEPLTLSLFAVGLTGAAALRRRAQQKTVARPD